MPFPLTINDPVIVNPLPLKLSEAEGPANVIDWLNVTESVNVVEPDIYKLVPGLG